MQWFERKFTFDLPEWMVPNIVERLRGTPARVDELVAGLDATVLTRRDGESWSIQEQVGHLFDLEPLWIGRIDDLLNGEERLRPADLLNKKTQNAGHNERSVDEVAGDFRSIRTEFVAQLDGFDETQFSLSAKHPRLEQPMRMLDLLFFVAEHDDHHLAAITRLKKQFAA